MFNFRKAKTAGDWIVHIARGLWSRYALSGGCFGCSYCESVHSGSPTSGISLWRRCFALFLASFPSSCCATRLVKREKSPALAIFINENWMDRLPCKGGDGTRPKTACRNIRMHHPNFPRTREPPPHLMRDLSSNSTPPVSTKNKQFRHIPDNFISTQFRPSLH